jgi:ABC-type glutathione transport system ATPase component
MLVFSGQAGAGKSVLTRFIAETILAGGGNERIQNTQGYIGVTFFCSYPMKQVTRMMCCCVLSFINLFR